MKLEKYLPKEGVIIDYGCGQGLFSQILSLLSPQREVYGVDSSEAKISEARKSQKSNQAVSFSADCNIERVIGSAEAIVIIDVLCYLADQDRFNFLKKLHDKLKPSATLVIKDQNKDSPVKFFFLYLQEFIAVRVLRITASEGLHFFSRSYMEELLGKVGFKVKVVDISRGYLYPHIAFICSKS